MNRELKQRPNGAVEPMVRSAQDAGGLTLLHVQQGRVYRSNPVGAWIWNELAEGKQLAEIEVGLCSRYEIPGEQAAADLRGFLDALTSQGMIEGERRAA